MAETTIGSGSYPIKTVVVLVQENRSFDHTLGWFKELNQDIDGVTKSDPKSNPVSSSDPNSLHVVFGDQSQYVDPDPGHSIQDIYEQVFGKPWDVSHPDPNPGPATMSGFTQNAERNKKGMSSAVMNGFKPDALPVYKELVQNFAISDKYGGSAHIAYILFKIHFNFRCVTLSLFLVVLIYRKFHVLDNLVWTGGLRRFRRRRSQTDRSYIRQHHMEQRATTRNY